MLKVAAVAKIICDNLEISADKETIIKTMLLHDMGNILRFNLENTSLFDKKDLPNINKFKTAQQNFKEKYHHDADEATLEIIKELTSNKKILNLCANSHGEHIKAILNKKEWEKKISYYSDMRIGPFGVLSVNERFDDLIARNPNDKKVLEQYKQECLEIEKQLIKICKIDIKKISNKLLEPEIKSLKTYAII
jgi:hypothetical protein